MQGTDDKQPLLERVRKLRQQMGIATSLSLAPSPLAPSPLAFESMEAAQRFPSPVHEQSQRGWLAWGESGTR